MIDLMDFKPSKEKKGIDIKGVRYTTSPASFESLYYINLKFKEEHPDASWFPEFQRSSVWTQEQKEQLIISMLHGLPIGSFYVNECWFDEEEKRAKMDRVLFDGQQRFTAIVEFLTGQFPITFEGKSYFVTDLSFQEWLRLKRHPISIIHSYIEDWNDLIDYYILINKGGTQHTSEEFRKALDCKE